MHDSSAIETPLGAGIAMHHMMTYTSGNGTIDHIINGTGDAAQAYSGD